MTQALSKLDRFKAALQDAERDDQTVLDEFYYNSSSEKLTASQEARLRRAIAQKFRVAMRDVVVTGSAKLGFTTVGKRDRPAFSPFSDSSDIDVALISTPLFVSMWRAALQHYETEGDWRRAEHFRSYLMRGWLRPDQLPPEDDFPQRREWFEFFRTLTASGEYGSYKIAAGVYYDETFWEAYVSSSLAKARLEIERPL